MLEVEDVDGVPCAVDDMKKMEVSTILRSESSRGEWKGGREKRGLGYEVMGGLQDAAAQAQDCEDLQSHTRQDSAYSCR